MANIIYKKRLTGNFKYAQCPNCYNPLLHNSIVSDKPFESLIPYCGHCGKVIFDISQNYCCWCGEKIKEAK